MWSGVGHVGQNFASAALSKCNQRVAGFLHLQKNIIGAAREGLVITQDRREGAEIYFTEGRIAAPLFSGSETFCAFDQILIIQAPDRKYLAQASTIPPALTHLAGKGQPAAE